MTGSDNDNQAISNAALVGRLLLLAAAMFGFGFALVPLYDVFCEITGFGGRTNASAVAATEAPDYSREIRVEFVTTVNQYAPWRFRAAVDSMTVHPGKMYYAIFTAENLSDRDKVAQAVPSVAPVSAAEYFRKIECFCFENQPFAGRQTRDMPLAFIVDPELPEYVDTITLQYTFFDTMRLSAADAD